MPNIAGSSKKLRVYEADLSQDAPLLAPQMSLSELWTKCREEIAKKFSEFLPKVLENYQILATTADTQETERKASEYIMNKLSGPDEAALGRMADARVQVQIINSIPMPEMSRVGGIDTPSVEVAGVKVAVGQLVGKKIILPELKPEEKRTPYAKEPTEVKVNKSVTNGNSDKKRQKLPGS